jgi:hypothetical protein
MFEFLKRLVSPDVTQPPPRRRKSSKKTSAAAIGHEPAPLPEVTEGNEHSDWELWEDSVVSLDSRMQGLMPSSKIYDDPERPSEYQDLDAYSKVSKKDP